MSDRVYVGLDIADFRGYQAGKPISRVTLMYDDENGFTAGDDSGLEVIAECYFATQEMVDAALEILRGQTYRPFEAMAAGIDPAAELGDAVTVNGVYAPLIRRTDSGYGYPDIEAPGEEELEDDDQCEGYLAREVKRKVTLGASYYGISIDRKRGIHIAKTNADGTTGSRATLNSDEVSFRNDDGTEALYFDINAGKFKFRGDVHITGGDLNINNNFIVDIEGNVRLNGDINLSGGNIVWGGNNPASGKISASQAKTLITAELVRSPTIAGGRFMDLEKQNWIEMGESEDGTVGYFNHYADSYSDTDPVMVMGYYNPSGISPNWVLAPFFNIALDYVLNNQTMYANGKWDFSQADVTGLDAAGGNTLAGTDCTIEADDDVTITAGDDVIITAGPVVIRVDAGNERINFWFGDSEVGYILDADGLNQA